MLLCGPVVSQEENPTPKTTKKKVAQVEDTDKEKEKEKAPDLKKTLAEFKKELAATKTELEETKKSAAESEKALAELKKEALSAATKAEAAGKTGDEVKKTVDALQVSMKGIGDFAETKKTVDETKKTLDEVKSTANDGKSFGDDAKKKGDTSWMLTSSAFVMFMVPGLALFYGGMVRRKNVLATMMQSMAALAVVGVFWIVFGYGLAFGPSQIKINFLGVEDGGVIGWSWDLFCLKGVAADQFLPGYNIPVYVHVMFQGMFAIITPALISGAIAERIRFWPFCIFMILWVSFVYCPLAHMVWAFDWFDPSVLVAKRGSNAIGFLGKLGALDFAGGTVVHIAAGMAGFAACLVLRRRDGYPKTAIHPNSMVLTLLGAGLLWFGWFGFNGGSATASTYQAASAFTATQAAAAAAGLGWMLIEWLHKGKPTALGLASGIVAGLVAVTPASGYVYVWGGIVIGLAAALICYIAVWLKGLFKYDDSLDAFGVHGIGGFVGAVLTGLFCSTAINPGGASSGGDGPFAWKWSRARVEEIKKELPEADKKAAEEAKKLDEPKKKVEEAEKKVADAEAEVKKITDAKGDAAEATKKLDEAKKALDDEKKPLADVQAVVDDAAATAKSLKDESDKLQAIIDKQDDKEHDGKDKKGPYSQFFIQVKAASISVGFAFVVSAILVLLTHVITLGNFSTSKKDETEGLDHSEHGEVGFDFGFATETIRAGTSEPRAATSPKGNGRFEVSVDGVTHAELKTVWNALCQPSDHPADPNFLAVYPHVTTLSGTKFRLRGGDHAALIAKLETLLKKRLPGKAIKVTPA